MPKPVATALTERQRTYLALLVSDNSTRATRLFRKRLDEHIGKFQTAGRTGSGADATGAFDVFRECLEEFADVNFKQALEISSDHLCFVIVATHIQSLKNELLPLLETVVGHVRGIRLQEKDIGSFASRLAILDRDVGRLIKLAEYRFNTIQVFPEVSPATINNNTASTRLRVSVSALGSWWEHLGVSRDTKTLTELHDMAIAHFPDKQVSRDRIRTLAGPRKRGPKEFGDKATAE